MRRSIVFTMFVLAACTRQADEMRPAPPSTAPVAAATTNEQLVDDLAMISLGRILEEPKRSETIAALDGKATTIDKVIDDLVRDPRFARVVIPRVLFGEMNFGPLSYYAMHILKTKEVDGQKVSFYRKDCTLADSVEVAPWWDAKHPIRVCKADYQPQGFKAKDGNTCSGTMATDVPECGCGPMLLNCVRDTRHFGELFESFRQEQLGIIAHVIENDEPFKQIILTKSSFRDRNVEAMRIRDKLYASPGKSVPDLSAWPVEGKYAPREELFPGAHSGILTSTQYLYMSDGPRDRMRLVFARTWCTTTGSFGVTSDQFRDLMGQHANIRSENAGWKELAAAPGCSECHARMDYGAQFMLAYPALGKSVTPILSESRHKERGPMYMRDIDDPRGEIPLTPEALGKLIVAQPEFNDCMVQRVEDHVLGTTASAADHEALLAAFTEDGKMRTLFRAALRKYVDRVQTSAPPVAAAAKPIAPAPAGDVVTFPEPLAAQIVNACGDCHDSGDDPFLAEFETKRTLPRELVLEAANLISSGMMPKHAKLERADKVSMLEGMIGVLAPDATWAANAHGYWLDEWLGSRTHHLSAVKERIGLETSYKLDEDDQARSVEEVLEGELMTLTPSYVTQVGQLALKACHAVIKDQAKYRACLRRETRPEAFLIK